MRSSLPEGFTTLSFLLSQSIRRQPVTAIQDVLDQAEASERNAFAELSLIGPEPIRLPSTRFHNMLAREL